MVVEVAVPEDDVRFVQPGMPTQVRLDAFPRADWEAEIQRVHPRAELIEHENVFVAELNIANDADTLRPGMRGQAKIKTVRRSLGWVLFHKACAAMLTWVGW
jgi:multidrug efflux pump subunit AcrA (membrane-fusion protein)